MFPVSARCRWPAGDLLGALVPIRAPAPVTLQSSQKLHLLFPALSQAAYAVAN